MDVRRLPLLVVAALVAAACTGGSSGSTVDTTVAPATVSSASPVTTVSSSTSTILDPTASPVRAQLDWFVRAINGGPLSEEVYQERFAEVFRLRVPFEGQFAAIVDQLVAVPGDWLVVSYSELTAEQGVGIVAAGDERMQVSITVDPEEPHRISGLLVQPADLESTPDTFENAIGRLEDLGILRLLAAEVIDGECLPVESAGADEPMPLGSAFKLFVLSALADAVADGDVSWEDDVVIRDELKSIPSGILQDELDGTVKSVREVARFMIAISDNTAADHLIDLLGRERVEAHLVTLGVSNPDLNVPFLTTREFAALKVGPSSGLRTQYLAADTEGRRAILRQISDIAAADLPLTDFDEPIDPDTLEWFASPTDMCRVLVHLWENGGADVRDILTVNPGVAPKPGVWRTVAFKGGSEPGLFAANWLAIDDGGRMFVLSASVVNPDELIDGTEAALVMAGARDLLAPSE